VIVILTDHDECARRIAADAERGDRRADTALETVSLWWLRYSPAPCDRIPEAA
jgi:hypothetical protein